MDETMFMAFSMEQDDYNCRVKDAAEEIYAGASIEEVLDYYNVAYEDVLEILQYTF